MVLPGIELTCYPPTELAVETTPGLIKVKTGRRGRTRSSQAGIRACTEPRSLTGVFFLLILHSLLLVALPVFLLSGFRS